MTLAKTPKTARLAPASDDQVKEMIRHLHVLRANFRQVPTPHNGTVLANAEAALSRTQRHRRQHGLPWISLVTPDYVPTRGGDGRSERYAPRSGDGMGRTSLNTWKGLTNAQRRAVALVAPSLALMLDRESR